MFIWSQRDGFLGVEEAGFSVITLLVLGGGVFFVVVLN